MDEHLEVEMSTFKCDYKTFYKMAGDFIKAIPETNDLEALDAGLKCVQLHFLGLEGEAPHETVGATAIMKIITRQFIFREVALS